jgi:hypothetical protein
MLEINLSNCKSVDDVRNVVYSGVPDGDRIVRNRREAKRLLRAKNVKGRVHSSVVFREHKTIDTIGPLRRNVLVCAMIEEYFANENPAEKAYSVEIITY